MSERKNDVPCSVADCGNLARPDRANQDTPLCWAHWKRRQRGVPLSTSRRERGTTPWKSLLNAIDNFSEAAADTPGEDARKAWKRIQGTLRKAINRYNARMRSRRRRPAS